MTRLVYNGRIYLNKNEFCSALLIQNGRIAKTGSSGEILEEAPAGTEKIDAAGALVLPGFFDSHLHLMWMGQRACGIECEGAQSVDEVIERGRKTISTFRPAPGSCIQGAGLNPDLFTKGEKRDPCRDDLDKISAEFPIVICRHCGHTIYCNSLALELAGLSRNAPQIEGGTIETDKNGRPSGVLRENANALVYKSIPPLSEREMVDYIKLAMQKAHSLGITSCGSFDSDGPDFEDIVSVYRKIYDEFRNKGKPGLRVNMQCGISGRKDMLDARLEQRSRNPLWEDPYWGTFLKIQSIKIFADGTLGGHTAWMKKPYRDKPQTCGFPVISTDCLEHFVSRAAAGGMQVLVHAIGDAGIDAVISAFEKVTGPGKNPLRHGIVHCQITSADLIERMAHNKILALVQPVFLYDDLPVLESRVGPELASTSYAWGTMHRLGIPASYSTDAPVSSPDPLQCIESAVMRRPGADPAGEVFCPGERTDIFTALEAYTAAGAFSSFNENSLGRIAPGFLADLVFLDRDIFAAAPEEISRTKITRTLCAGETVFRLH